MLVQKFLRPALTAGLALSMMCMVQGCTDDDVLAGVLAVGVVAGAVAIGVAASNSGDHHDHDHHHGHDRWNASFNIDESQNLQAIMTPSAADTFASKYGVPMTAATRLTSALQDASAGNIQAVYALGLTQNDLQDLGYMQMISSAGITNLASHLQLDEGATQTLVARLISDLKSQASNINSAYWQSCTSRGSWKTPQNMFCNDATWVGCSPQTGATLCAAN